MSSCPVLPGQKPDTLADLAGLLGLVADLPLVGGSGIASGSSTAAFFVIQIDPDLETGGRDCDFALLGPAVGGSCGMSFTLDASVSFLRANHMPEL